MRFEVPQYLDVPDRIFGQFTLKQVVYMVGSIGAAYILWRWLPIFIAIPIAGGMVALAFMLSFTPDEKFGKSFEQILESAIKFTMKPRLYTWKRVLKKKKQGEEHVEPTPSISVNVPTLSHSNLSTMSWALDVGEKDEV
jgi:hypothetical protein